MRPVEILTLAPLGALVVALGLFPGLLLDLIQASVGSVIAEVASAGELKLALWP
jgi:NADH:ubiquinone oxidoreductase subunit 4 (subunit M)